MMYSRFGRRCCTCANPEGSAANAAAAAACCRNVRRSTLISVVRCRLAARMHRRIRDAELLQVVLVLARIVVVLLHLLAVLCERFRVELRRRLVLRPDQRLILHILRL